MFDWVEFLVSEAFVAVRRNGLMSLAAVSTVATALFLIGGLGYLYLSVAGYAQTVPGKFEMRVYLKEGTNYAQIRSTADAIRHIAGVGEAAWIPRDKAWELERRQNPDLTEGLDKNPYPDSFKVKLTNLNASDSVASAIQKLDAVEPNGVKYLRDEQEFVGGVLRLIRWIGGVLGGILFVTGGVLIYNAIRLTIMARHLEIRIMSLVGASRLTIEFPFLIEGALQGVVGGLLAALLLSLGYGAACVYLASAISFAKMPPLAWYPTTLALAATGMAYGIGCSLLAVRGPLRVR